MLGEIKLSHIWETMVEILKPFLGSMHWAELPRAKRGFLGRAHKLQGSLKHHTSSHPLFLYMVPGRTLEFHSHQDSGACSASPAALQKSPLPLHVVRHRPRAPSWKGPLRVPLWAGLQGEAIMPQMSCSQGPHGSRGGVVTN